MLFKEILHERYTALSPLFNELFDLALKRQTPFGRSVAGSGERLPDGGIRPRSYRQSKMFYNIGPNIEYHCETANLNLSGSTYVVSWICLMRNIKNYISIAKSARRRSMSCNSWDPTPSRLRC